MWFGITMMHSGPCTPTEPTYWPAIMACRYGGPLRQAEELEAAELRSAFA